MEVKISQTSVQRYAKMTVYGTCEDESVNEEVLNLIRMIGHDALLNTRAKYTCDEVWNIELRGVVAGTGFVTLMFFAVHRGGPGHQILVDVPGTLGIKF